MKQKIKYLIEVSSHFNEGGLIASMGQSNIQSEDIPRVTEAYSLLEHFVEKLPIVQNNFDHDSLKIEPCIAVDNRRLVLLMPIKAEMGKHICHWLFDNIYSEKLKAHAGIVAIPFQFATIKERLQIIPDWFFCFYPEGEKMYFTPSLIIKSALNNDLIGEDWVSEAVARMTFYRLPTQQI